MALVFNNALKEGFKYIIESDKGEKNPFSVTINPIDSVRLVQLEDGLLKRGTDNTLSIATGSYNVSLCVNSIVGWEGMADENGKPIEIVKDIKGFIAIQSLEQLPTAIITEVAGVIASVSQDPKNIQLFSEED